MKLFLSIDAYSLPFMRSQEGRDASKEYSHFDVFVWLSFFFFSFFGDRLYDNFNYDLHHKGREAANALK